MSKPIGKRFPLNQFFHQVASAIVRLPGIKNRNDTGVLELSRTARFAKNATRFLGAKPPRIEHVAERSGRLAFTPNDSEPIGQFVRASR